MRKLLIVVDMINDFCDEKGVLSHTLTKPKKLYAKSIIPNVKVMVDTFRQKKDPIIWLCDSHAKNDLEFNRFPPHAIKDTWGAEIIDQLDSEAVKNSHYELVINKTRYSGFHNTELAFRLGFLNPATVHVVGVCTSICVMDTVGGLANRDYDITVPRDCVADFDSDAHIAALRRMEQLYGAKII